MHLYHTFPYSSSLSSGISLFYESWDSPDEEQFTPIPTEITENIKIPLIPLISNFPSRWINREDIQDLFSLSSNSKECFKVILKALEIFKNPNEPSLTLWCDIQ